MYERRHLRREQGLEQKWGALAGVAKFLSDDPQSTKAWAKGESGEVRLAAHLHRVVGGRATFLHDRKVPGTRGNIDHLAVVPSGVWIIDAKNYRGRVEHRDVGGWFKTDHRIFVGGRDRTKVAEGLAWQVAAVRVALAGLETPIHPAVCFTNSEWGLFAKPFQHNGVWVGWAQKLSEELVSEGPLDPQRVARVSARLAERLPPAVKAPRT